ncbi:MAG: RHS repeat-associated core domain-containing protein, partial [Desulfobacteraceae bacterium]|nr:RHS repeat-associated core domain-containing protein [Desulfobacteraceae bacterium]
YTYDRVGNLIGYHDGLTAAFYSYDAAHRKIAETVDYGPFSLSYGYDYYANGMKKSFTAPDGTTYQYTYDANNQFSGVALPGAGFVTVNAHRWNRPEHITLPGGGSQRYVYDPLMRISSIAVDDPGQKGLMDYHYTYDRVSNITIKDTEHGNYSYRYDPLYRLLAASTPKEDETFTYDPLGNRLTAEGVAGSWRYNRNNELLEYGDLTFDYDANGNMIRKTANGRVLDFIYNTEDRLVRVEEPGGKLIAEYGYDPFGRRLWKYVDGIQTYFLYSDEGVIGEYAASGAELKAYGWKPGSIWGTDPLFMKIEGSYYFYHNDHLGTPQKMTAVNGSVVWKAKYTSFGEADIEDDSIFENHLRFAGQYLDEETGLHYNWNRYYDSAIGRYLTTDPLGIQKEEINLFLYVKANPIRYIDNTGLLTCGSGRNEPFVPDNPFGFGFSDCCQQHDDCYGTCGAEKTQCDDNFEQCMINSCISEGQGRPLRQALCRSWARRYSWWVRNAGGSAFENAQTDCNCPNENQ